MAGAIGYAMFGGRATIEPSATAPVLSVAAPATAALVPPALLDRPKPVTAPPVIQPSPTRASLSPGAALSPAAKNSDAGSITAGRPALIRPLYIVGREVPVRVRPSGDALITDRLRQGLKVSEVSRQGGWIKVRHPITQGEGWISARWTSAEPPQDAATSQVKKKSDGQPPSLGPALATAAVIKLIIAHSVADYRATRACACPYNTTRTGRACGGNSAWSKRGGAAPLCYASDVTPAMITAYRAPRVAGSN